MKSSIKVIKKSSVSEQVADTEMNNKFLLPLKKGVVVEKIASWITEKRVNQELEISQLKEKIFGNTVLSSSHS